MINKDNIADIVHAYLAGGDLFLVSVRVSTRNKVMVFIDGDHGVTISDCAGLSRHIEGTLDREKEDFELDVSSVGVGTPLTMTRQYKNNIGRLVSIALMDDTKLRGKLIGVDENGLRIEKEIKAKGKKKKNPDTDKDDVAFVGFDNMAEVKVLPQY